MREDIRIYVEDVVENIDKLSDYKLTNYLMDEVLRMDSYELDEENTLDISDPNDKLEFLKAIYENIIKPEDQQTFIREILENETYLDSRIVEEFRGLVQFPEGFDDNVEESTEEPEEEQELDEPTQSFDSDSDVNTNPEQNEEELEEKEITKYEAITAEMEREYEALLAKMNGAATQDEPNYIDAIEILKNSIAENNEIRNRLNSEPYNLNLPIVEPSEDLKKAMDEATSVYILNKEIEALEKDLESINKNIEALEEAIQNYKHKPGSPEMRFPLTKEKFEREKQRDAILNELNAKKYKKQIALKSSTILDATKLRTLIVEESVYANETKNAIDAYKLEIEKAKENVPGMLLVGEGTFPDRLNKVIDNLYKAQKTFENDGKEIEVNVNIELSKEAENLKKEIEKRKENAAKYHDALKDINELGNEIKAGKKPEELQDKIEAINKKIETITDDKLKDELRGELNKALNPKKEQEKDVPEQPKDKTNDKKKWHKWMGALGLALGGAAAALIPGGFLGALAISAGAELVNAGYTAYKVHQKRKQEKELAPENEVTNISRIEKVKLAYQRLKKDIKELNENDKWFKNITWLLHGTAIGSLAVGTAELIKGGDLIEFGKKPIPDPVPEPVPEPVPQQPNIKVGDSMNGMDLSTGHDTAKWAINGTNPEALNQSIMNDGQTVVRRIMDAQGNTYMSTEEALKAGKSLSELSFDGAKSLTMDDSVSRAFVNAEKAMRTL